MQSTSNTSRGRSPSARQGRLSATEVADTSTENVKSKAGPRVVKRGVVASAHNELTEPHLQAIEERSLATHTTKSTSDPVIKPAKDSAVIASIESTLNEAPLCAAKVAVAAADTTHWTPAPSMEAATINEEVLVASALAQSELKAACTDVAVHTADATKCSSDFLFEPSAAREKIDAALTSAQVRLDTTPFIDQVLVQSRAAPLWPLQVLSMALARAQLLQQLADSTYADVKVKGLRVGATEAAGSARQVACQWTASAKGKAQDAIVATSEIVSEPVFKTSAAAAAVGGTTLGAAGATSGVVVGGVAGGLAGLPLAFFTFGLSIPAGVVLGSSAGGALGLASGTAVGLLGGGAIGFTAFKKQDKIREVGASAMGKVNDSAGYVKGRARASAEYAREAVKVTRQRLTGACTGGTDEAMH